ncbi:MAG: glycosyltransferase [Caulobacter sp.]
MIGFLRQRRFRTIARQAESAMARGDWSDAAAGFVKALHLMPQRSDLRVQYAHALKELGQTPAALAQYELASADNDDGCYHLVSLKAQVGDREEATEALADLLRRSPDYEAAYSALHKWGLSDLLPSSLKDRLLVQQHDGWVRSVKELETFTERIHILGETGLERYDEVRARMLRAAPFDERADAATLRVIVDARRSQPAFVRSTLISLRESRHRYWEAVVIASAALRDHPVASLADLDERIRFLCEGEEDDTGQVLATLYLSAGTCVEPAALGWMAHVMATTETTACMSDWDHCISRWDGPDRYFDPKLHGQFDVDWLLTTDFPPPLIAIRQDEAGISALDPEGRREALAALFLSGKYVAHVPLPLASVTRIPDRAEQARESEGPAPVWSLPPAGFSPKAGLLGDGSLQIEEREGRPPVLCGVASDPQEAIRVIIPTRDCASLLDDMVSSLLACAEEPGLVHITILDNRSAEGDTAKLLERLAAQPNIDIMVHDAPFNWSLMNNRAVKRSSEPLLVFANNDMRMLSQGWDRRVRGQLSRLDIGILGARLLYPDGSIQHAGMLMGLADGSPVHDGVFGIAGDAQANERFDRMRVVPAVTGAFLALRRSLFDDLGGFDAEHFAIAYNDVDLCLAARQAGYRILYDPAIELIHYESRTRGFNDNRIKIAWDQGELRALFRKWGQAMMDNPTISPWWSQARPYSIIDAGLVGRDTDIVK